MKSNNKPINNHVITILRITTVAVSLDKLLFGQLAFMNQFYKVIVISSNNKEVLDRVRQREGVDVFSVELSRIISPIRDIVSLVKLVLLINNVKPDILHTHTPKAGFIGMLAAFLAKTTIRLHTVAGLPLLEAKGLKRVILNLIEKLTYFCAHKVYPNSNGLMKIIINNGYCKTDKLKVLANGSSNGIDVSHFTSEAISELQVSDINERYIINADNFVFIFIGRLVGDKGINELVYSFDQISQKYINVKLLLVGPFENDLDKLSEDTIDAINRNKQIQTAGYVEDVRPFFAVSNVLTFPSYREGFPNVVMQAGAMGLPSIVTDINGCNEIIVDGENGIIIPPKDADALYGAMESFLINPELQAKLAKNARDMIVSRYEQSVVWEAIKGEYDYWCQFYNPSGSYYRI